MKSPRKIYFLIPLLLLLLAGCSTQYQVRVDGLSARDGLSGRATGQSYELVSRTEGVSEDDLFFKEIARHLRPVLKQAGFQRAQEGTRPDLKIRVNAYLSEPLVESRSYSEPVYLDRPGYSQTVRIPVLNSDGRVVRYAYRQYWSPPRQTFAGYVDRDQQITVYDKVLHLSARAVSDEGDAGEEIWSLKIALRGQSTDYRSSLPVMLVASKPYLGKRTEGEQTVMIKEDNAELEAYRSLMYDGR